MQMSLTVRLLNYLTRQSRIAVWLITAASLVALGLIDYSTGSKITITFFYLLPVSLASWSLGKATGRLAALLSAITMQAAQILTGGESGVPLVLWNTAVRMGVFLVVANLIWEFRHQLRHQTELSRTDPLTGILNLRAFQEAGDAEVRKMRGHVTPLTLAFMDIDDFKTVNDTFGHAAGDALLLSVAECLKSQLWGTDAVARLGGDEYAILLPHTDASAAKRVLPRLKDTLLLDMAERKWPVTFSIGVVTCITAPPDIKELVHLADQLMYAAKRAGKDRIKYGLYPQGGHSAREESIHPAADQVREPQ